MYSKEQIYNAFKHWAEEVDSGAEVIDISNMTPDELAEEQTKYLITVMETN